MSKIHVLSEHLTNMIAAGEVVDRPANIVKECVENSMDAHAHVIDVQVYQGGIERIIITDDGDGMDHQDANLAFYRHATSKIQNEDDLFNIGTMGFRGEAIPSIASVAHMDMQTSNGQEGTHIIYDYGKKLEDEKVDCPKGCKIDVSGLFIKTPARFKHLKSVNYEFSIIANLINRLALSHPDIRFTLSHDDHIVFQTTGDGNLKQILYQMYGREVAKNAIPFDAHSDDFHIHGYAVQPKITRATKYFMFLSLNTRLIRSNAIQKAILDAYEDFLPKNRYPIVVLQIESDTQLVDVNVHPNKWEVRLSKQGELLTCIKDTLTKTLRESLQTVEVKKIKKTPVYEQPSIQFPYPIQEAKQEPIHENRIKEDTILNSFTDYVPQKVEENIPVEEESTSHDHGYGFFDHLQVLAQLHDSYILCSNPEGLVIIDQHAAQERYHYEQIKETLKERCTKKQPLMVPLRVNVTSDVIAQVDNINEKTDFFGLHFDVFGDDQVIIREIPLWFHDVDQEAFLNDLLDYFVKNQDVDMLALRHKVLATMACHSSIRFNRPLSKAEMQQVIDDLKKCKQPYHCPHGRPTVITMSDDDLRKEFERG
ncbi:DNA mismatch repair endonuclease MutL [Absicoccus intestinalis]|uniref:DNA mismatch repair protein MutL n=1 Tax=Absicoccus intestinalis TaxID=2926319 RepID=A0ABU4WRA5_9FIRM|nr:DNA mismatch repair endonuclease MutL [Absicoccus sp. CLA-KB-P134]MDX8418002.1 DNA mismatch repair endonuclease MutL [Absicoccus sp. CLA-KB-P134]